MTHAISEDDFDVSPAAHEQLKETVAELQASNKQLLDTFTSERLRSEAATRDLRKAEEALSGMRRQVHALELETARLRGYLERVAEDDAVREGLVQVPETRHVPRRPPARFYGDRVMTDSATDNSNWRR